MKPALNKNTETQARIIRLQAALKIAQDALKTIVVEGDGRMRAAAALDKIEERMMKR